MGAIAFGEAITWRMLGGAGLVVAAILVNAGAGDRGAPPEPRATAIATPAD